MAARAGTLLLLLLLSMPGVLRAQEILRAQETGETPETIDTTPQDAGVDDDPEPRRRLVKWNEFEGPFSTFRFGFGFLLDFSDYAQDRRSEQQFPLDGDIGVRDSRLLFRGRFQTKRPLSWTVGYMYDGADDEWRFRQTGIQIGFPRARGQLFIGRTKEGYSMIKTMTGYHPWTQERSFGLDAFVPILADGLKWMGWIPGPRVFYSVGLFGDMLSEDESFASYDHQAVTRIGWLPIASEEDKTVWHVAVMARAGRPDEGSIRWRSRPEDSLAPYFVETPGIEADAAGTVGAETYYRKGPVLFGGEYNWQTADPEGRNPQLRAWDVVAVWLVTGETRGYNARGGYFEAVSPDDTVFKGGPGAWEAVLHFSFIDLDDGSLDGGTMWRLTPMVNWHMSDNVRLEFVYGYCHLDRFDLEGRTHFLQARLQFTL
jgi:phosphate-selective porin OprO/OprP